jgi:Planctomycete extracellular/Beta-propeller repeat
MLFFQCTAWIATNKRKTDMSRHPLLKRKPSRANSPKTARRLAVESLEDRRVLSVDFGGAFALGSTLPDAGGNVTVDAVGNTYVSGSFRDTVDFDPGPAVYPLTSTQDSGGAFLGNVFVAKYDSAGELLWAQRMGGSGGTFGPPDLAVGDDGAVFVTGSFLNTADFGATMLTSQGDSDPFVTKLDANGNFLWARQLTSSVGRDNANGVAVDATGNAFVIGEVRTLPTLVPDAFITKLDSAGNEVWTKEFGASTSVAGKGKSNSSSFARGFDIALDTAGDIYATGRMGGTVDFDPGPGTSQVDGAGEFILKLDGSGSVNWARNYVGEVEVHGIAVDAAGSVYTTGTFSGTTDFDPAAPTGKGKQQNPRKYDLTSSSGLEVFAAKLDANGDFAWAKQVVSSGSDGFGTAMALDATANVYVTGHFSGTADFDPGPGTFNLTSAGGSDAFVWKLDSNGNLSWAVGAGTSSQENGNGIAVDTAGNVYTTGYFSGTVDFDPGPGVFDMTSAGGIDAYVWELTQSGALAAAGAGASTSSSDLRLAANTIEEDSASAPTPTNFGVQLSVAAEPRKSLVSVASLAAADPPRTAAADRALAGWHGTTNRHGADDIGSLDDDVLEALVVGKSRRRLLV